MTLKLLVVDDDADIWKIVSEAMDTRGYQVDTSLDLKSARTKLDEMPYDVLLTDKNMPAADGAPEGGMGLLRYARWKHPGTEVIVMTGYANIQTVVEALGKTSAYAEQLRDTISTSDPGWELVEQICKESCNRF